VAAQRRNARGDSSRLEREEAVERPDAGPAAQEADVILDVPVLNVEELNLEVEDLRAHISARAELADFVKISVGVDVYLDKVKLEIKGVEAQAQLKVRLERILGTIERALGVIEQNPGLLDSAFREDEREDRSGQAVAELEAPEREVPEREPPDAATGETRDSQPADGEQDVGSSSPAATEVARRKAEELGVDLAGVRGTGAGGRVLVRDVVKAAG
jgi:hypothetical protein